MKQFFLIILLSIAASVGYGIIHDQITAGICIEYFTIGHPIIIPTQDPTILGILWGIIATWWVGAIFGIVLAIVARLGSQPKRSAKSLIKPMGKLLMIAAGIASISGGVGYMAAINKWVWLAEPWAERVPL